MVALGDEESISHAAADDKGIDLIEEVVDDADLVGDLCAAEDSDEGLFGCSRAPPMNSISFWMRKPQTAGR